MANPKRKSLMAVLTEYQNENNKSGLTEDGDSKSDIAEARARMKKVKAQAAAKKKAAPKKKSAPKAKTAPKAAPKAKPAAKKTEKAAPMPSNPQYKNITMKPRKKRPGTGRTGEAAAKAANRKPAAPKKTMTAAERRKMRLRARRGR